jgi:outer membrane protein TolC
VAPAEAAPQEEAPMRSRALCRTLAAAALALAPAAQAKEDPTQASLASWVAAPSLQGRLELSLADALALGLENNLGLEIQRHTPLIAWEDSRIAWGAYDPDWITDFGWTDDRRPNSNELLGVDETVTERLGGEGGVRGLLPWLNTAISTTFVTSETDVNTGIQALSPEYRTGLAFVARQPLLRGLIWNETWTLVKTSAVAYQGSLEEFRRVLMDTVSQIENAYWALIANEERVRVAQKSRETAQALLDQVKTQYEVGVVSKVEVVEAEAGLATREFDLITAQNVYENSMDALIDLVLGPNLAPDSEIHIEPSDRPDDYVPYDIDVEQAAELAFQHRPEIAFAQRVIEQREILLSFAKNQRLPQFDIEGRYGHEGLFGSENPSLNPAFGAANAEFFGGWTDSFDPQSNSYGIRGIVTVPLGNVEGRHSVSKAELELRRARVQKRRVEQDIVIGVRTAARTLESAQEGIEAAERGRVAAEEQLRAERIRLEYGESTPFDVLQREEQLVTAEQQYIFAFQIYRNAVTGLDRQQGTILRNRNIQIEPAARLR